MRSDPCAATVDRSSGASKTSETAARTWSMVKPGTRIGDRYRVLRFLGNGATGAVYEAVDEQRSGLHVAIKLLIERHPQALYRLKNEFRALAETVHDNLVGLHGLGTDALGWFVVMDLIDPSVDFFTYVREGEGFPHAGDRRSYRPRAAAFGAGAARARCGGNPRRWKSASRSETAKRARNT
jgi:hypothetical protein